MDIVKQYHDLALKSPNKTEFVKTVRAWWHDRFNVSPPASQYLYKWYERHGY